MVKSGRKKSKSRDSFLKLCPEISLENDTKARKK